MRALHVGVEGARPLARMSSRRSNATCSHEGPTENKLVVLEAGIYEGAACSSGGSSTTGPHILQE